MSCIVLPMSKPKRRPQAPKIRNESYMRGMQDIRFGNAAGPHKSKKSYNRKPKHRNQEW